MAFFESRFPPRLAYGARGGPMFSTEVNETVGGHRYVNSNWVYPLHVYDVSQGVKTEADFQEVRSFFYNVKGRKDAFRFKDWSDFTATNQPMTVISAGSTYQLTKAYITGSRTYSRAIYKPVSVAVTRNRSSVLSTPSSSVDLATGIVSVSGHTGGDIYTWSGEFDVPVAFVLDQCEAIITNRNHRDGFLIEWPSIQLKETREIV